MSSEKSVKPVKKIVFPEWARILYRGMRGAMVTAMTQTLVLKVDLSDPQKAFQLIITSFLSGFLVAFGMFIRDQLGEQNIISKTMPF
jgi:glucose uptake protein GlcU